MTNATKFTSNPETSAQARSRMYHLLSVLFRYPTPELFESLANGAYPAQLDEALEASAHQGGPCAAKSAELAEKLRAILAGMDYRDYEVRYTQTFEVGAPKPLCPPYEGVQRKGLPRNSSMLNIAAFYKHFGLKIGADEGSHELPDHISAELEFLHFLAFKEAQAREAGDTELLTGYLLAQNDFLQRHLVRWVPDFANRLETIDPGNILAVYAGYTASFLNEELDLVRAGLKELGVETTLLDEPDEIPVTASSADDLSPGCAACLDAGPE